VLIWVVYLLICAQYSHRWMESCPTEKLQGDTGFVYTFMYGRTKENQFLFTC
jgi:hypothetical protein